MLAGVRHDLPRRPRAQDDLRRLPGRPRARRRDPALPLRGPRPPRRAAARPSCDRAAAGLHRRRQQHDRQRSRPARVRRASRASTARCCTSTTRTASASSASARRTSRAPTACAATASCATSARATTNIVLVGGFSKAYSSLLAFIACPTAVKNLLKVAAPPYLYSGPSPVASLATVLAGFEVNELARRRSCAATLHRSQRARPRRARASSTSTRPTTPGLPIVEIPLRDHERIDEVGDMLFDRGIYVDARGLPARAEGRGRLPRPADRGQHRRAGRSPDRRRLGELGRAGQAAVGAREQ